MSPAAAPLRRGLLWGLLVAALVAVAAAALWSRLAAGPPPPVLGAAPEFALVDQHGRPVALADLAGVPWIADFVFTRCPTSCPMMTARLARLEKEIPTELEHRLVSITVDPEHDTPRVLEAYARGFSAPDHWLFLTGAPEEIRRVTVEGFKLALEAAAPGAAEPILHSTRLVLVDGHGRIRGYYDAFDEAEAAKLLRDLRAVARGR